MQQQQPVKFGEMLQFILDNRVNTRAFKGMTEDKILRELVNWFTMGKGLYSKDSVTGQLNGVIILQPHYRCRILYVRHILCTSPEALESFLEVFKQAYPSFKLAAKRKGRTVIYHNTDRLCKMLLSSKQTSHCV